MTQKQAVANILQTINWKPARYQLVMNWLEDINWHTENAMIAEKLTESEAKTLNLLEEFDYALRPSNYSYSFIQDHKEELKKYDKSVDDYHKSIPAHLGDIYLGGNEISDFHNAQDLYRGLSYIWGWGLTTTDWKDTQGKAFTDELLEVIDDPEKFSNK